MQALQQAVLGNKQFPVVGAFCRTSGTFERSAAVTATAAFATFALIAISAAVASAFRSCSALATVQFTIQFCCC
jgi:hypothetical protein